MGSITPRKTCPLGSFIWQRIEQLGVRSVMGVPGDMTLELLDYIYETKMQWIGNANELNAAYAADAYCRVTGVPGVLVTTMGVGELSALNGVAGAYTEQVKLIHIVGTTATKTQAQHAMIHHCLGPNPDHRVYDKISAHVRAAHCWLDDIETAPFEIDRVIRECYVQSLPVYIFLPMDFVHQEVPLAFLDHPVDLSPKKCIVATSSAVEMVTNRLQSAKSPVIIVDTLVQRFQATQVVRHLLDFLRVPTFVTPMGKSIVDETSDYYHGVYNGQVSYRSVIEAVENRSDLVIDLGPLLSDTNTGGHSRKIRTENYITVGANCVSFGVRKFRDVPIYDFLDRLCKSVQQRHFRYNTHLRHLAPPSPADAYLKQITQSWIWNKIGTITRANDIVIAESGTAQFGFPDAPLSSGVQYVTQPYLASVGYSVPACLGAALAKRDMDREGRILLIVGDGSLQMTVQEIGTMIKLGLNNIIIFVVSNHGYTIERAIHGPEQPYNDIATWNHQLLLSAFGDSDGEANSRRVETKVEFNDVVNSPAYTNPQSIQLLEVMMDKMDVPWRLQTLIDLLKQRNANAAKEA